MEIVKVAAEVRNSLGKKANKAARKEGKIPGVIYGGDTPIHFSTTSSAIKAVVYTSEFKLIDLEIDGKITKCILKDIQFHPVTDNIIHVDFLRLHDNVSINVEVPVKFTGSSPGVVGGGKLIQSMRKIKLKTTPQNLVNHVIIDISDLELGSAVRVKDIIPMEGVQIMNVFATPVASVEVPRALRSGADEEEEGEGVTEGGEGATDEVVATEE